jgi:lipid-A-disaccharide synthase
MVVAGEASGDTLAAELITALKEHDQWRFFGVGGPRMHAAGVELVYDLTAHAVVGIWEVLTHYPQLRRLFHQLLSLAIARQPDIVILVDYPGFNLRFAAALKNYVRARRGSFLNWRPKLVYYVSPQLWAWHASRVHQIARDVDLLLSIFPFEKSWYASRAPSLRVEFVGHPLIDRYGSLAHTGQMAESETVKSRSAIETGKTTATVVGKPTAPRPSESVPSPQPSSLPLVLLLPGSRARELNKHLPVMVAAVRAIEAKVPSRWLMILPNESLVELARPFIAPLGYVKLQPRGLAESLDQAQLAIASSGTVTMECAYFGVPTVVIYRTSWGTYQLAKRFVKVQFIAMPNLLAQEMVYPECLQQAATPDHIATEAIDLLREASRRAVVQQKLAQVIKSLGEPGASRRAAQAVMSLVGN